MKLRKRMMAGMMAAGLAVGVTAGNGSVVCAEGADTSEHVVLTMYCIGDEGGIYAQQHLDMINELLTEKINAEISPVMVSWGDYRQKLPMVWASGESYDLTYTSNWSGYFTEGSKGAFMDITELFPEYAPLTYAELEEKDRLETTKINGKLYMVPNDAPDYTTYIYNYREDLRKKYGCPEIVDQETLKAYLQAIAENEPGMSAYSNNANDAKRYQLFLNEQDWSRPLEGSTGVFVYDLNDPTKVFDVTETPEYAEFLKETREFFEAGYWSQSIMAQTNETREMFESGQSGLYLGSIPNSNTVYQNVSSNHPDWEIGYFSSDLALSEHVESVTPSNNGMAVGAYSRNPERAMMFIELMYQDQEVFNLVMNGIEGVTYEKDDATMTKWIPEGVNASDIALKNLGMGFDTEKFKLGSKNDSSAVLELKDAFEEKAIMPGLGGFSIVQDNISSEIAALQSVYAEFKVPLEKGVVDDPEKGLEQLHEKLKAAGSENVLEEINAQIAEYLAAES